MTVKRSNITFDRNITRCLFCIATFVDFQFIKITKYYDCRSNQIIPSTGFIMKFHFHISLILICSVTLFTNATLAPPDKNRKTKPVKELKVNKGPVEKNVFDRNLVQDEPTSESIVKECGTYYKNTSARLFDGPTLGFVTPVSFECNEFFFIDCLLLTFFFC